MEEDGGGGSGETHVGDTEGGGVHNGASVGTHYDAGVLSGVQGEGCEENEGCLQVDSKKHGQDRDGILSNEAPSPKKTKNDEVEKQEYNDDVFFSEYRVLMDGYKEDPYFNALSHEARLKALSMFADVLFKKN